DIEMLDRISHGDVPKLSSAVPDCPPALEAIFARATAFSKADRYATANEMRQDILAYLDGSAARSSAGDVGKYVSEMFRGRRAEMKAIIERQLTGLRRASTEDVGLRVVDVRRLNSTDSAELPRASFPSSPSGVSGVSGLSPSRLSSPSSSSSI